MKGVLSHFLIKKVFIFIYFYINTIYLLSNLLIAPLIDRLIDFWVTRATVTVS